MLANTRGIVLRAVKYGDTSLICTVFTALYGVQAYMVQGVRKSKNSRAGLLQPATLLDLVVYKQPQKNLQRIREFQPAYIYTSLQEEIVKNSVALFSVEVLLRLLPENAIAEELFDFVYDYFIKLDQLDVAAVANFPLYFIIQCSSILGYTVTGEYSEETPYLSQEEGSYSAHPPVLASVLTTEDGRLLTDIIRIGNPEDLRRVEMNAAQRFRLIGWYMEFLHRHSQHMGAVRSLAVLQAILH